METKLRFLIIIVGLLSAEIGLTQPVDEDSYFDLPITGNSFYPYYMQYDKTPFLTDDWCLGSIKLISGERYDSLLLNYDIYKNNLLYFNSKLRRIVQVDAEIVKEFWLHLPDADSTVHVVNRLDDQTTGLRPGFYILLLDDSVSLILKKWKEIDAYSSTIPGSKKLGMYFERSNYYYYMSSSEFTPVPLRKRKLAKLFPQSHDQILKFISVNNCSIRNQNDLIKVFAEINRLQKEKK